MTDPNQQPLTPPQQYAAPAYSQQGAPAAGAAYLSNPSDKMNVLAIVSLITSIVGLSLVGVICGHISKKQIKRTGEKGRGLATAGLIIGYVGLVFGAIWIIAAIVAVAAGGMDVSSY